MESNAQDTVPSAALMFMIDPSAALRAAERAASGSLARRRHSIIMGRMINEDEARFLDRQREQDRNREAAGAGWSDDDLDTAH
ncbi:MAG TPA: hypothetical protein PK359_19325 [Burkholderiaceae bacterium]|jgi:hypothetical protein|nr:hypothetical protein [Burkholderiaceae bacterium]